MITTTINCPPMQINFNKNLLSTPIFGYNAKYLLQIGDFLLKKIHSSEFKKHPSKRNTLKEKHKKFMELYEIAKNLEEQNKEKAHIKTKWIGYRPRLSNKNDQRVFERLRDRTKTSVGNRNNA